jgi:hypothetical protein
MGLPKFLSNIGHAVGNFFSGGNASQPKKKQQPAITTPSWVQPQQNRRPPAFSQATPAPVQHLTVPFKLASQPKIAVPSIKLATPGQAGANFLNTLKIAPKPTFATQPTSPGADKTVPNLIKGTVRSPMHLIQGDIIEPIRSLTAAATHNQAAMNAAQNRIRQLHRPQQLAGDIANTLLSAVTFGSGEVPKEAASTAITALAPKILTKTALDTAVRKGTGELGKFGLKEVSKKVAKDIAVQTGYGLSTKASEDGPLTKEDIKHAVVGGLVFGGLGGIVAHSPDIVNGVRKLPPIIRTKTLQTATADSPVQDISTNLLTSYEKADRPTVEQYKRQIQAGHPVDPLIVMPDTTGNLGVEDGKNRLQAYKELGVKKVPVQLTTPQRLQTSLQNNNISLPGITKQTSVPSQIAGYISKIRIPEGQVSRSQASKALKDAGYKPTEVDAILGGATFTNKLGDQAISSTSLLDSATGYHAPTATQALTTPLSDQAASQIAVRDTNAPVGLNTTASQDVKLLGDGVRMPPGAPGGPQDVVLADTGKATRYASKTVPESDVVSPELQGTVKAAAPTYQVAPEKDTFRESLNRMQAQGIDGLATDVTNRLDVPLGSADRQTVADAETVAAALDVRHDPASLQQATDIYDKISAHLTASGQAIQAAAIIARRSPEGLRQFAQREFARSGVALTPELQSGLAAIIDGIRNTQIGTPERNRVVAGLMQFIGTHIPTQAVDKLVGVYKAGLLTGIRTQTGNALSNTAFLALKKASDPIAVAFDKAIGLVTGKRSKTLTGLGLLPGAKEGIKKGYSYLKTGIDERAINNDKYEVGKQLNYKNKFLNAYVNGVFRLMGAADQPVWYASYRDNLVDLAKTEAINQGLHGSKLRTAAEAFVTHPSDTMQATAAEAATKAVLGNETIGSKAARAVLNASKNPIYRAFAHTTMPFTKVPSAFIARVFDYTPVGPVKEILTQIYRHKFDQRKLAEALAEGTTGTAGAITIGAALSKAGLLTGAYPTDPKEQQAWKAESKQENSIKIGDQWHSLNYVGPFGALFGIGGGIEQTLSNGGTVADAVSTATTGAVQSALNQSFLSGVSGFLDAINQPQQSAKQFVNQEAASLIPTLVGDVAKAGDTLQRQANTAADAIKAKIPGARETLLPKQDAFGNNLKRPTSALGTLIDPFRSSTATDNPLTKELDRLQQAKQGVFPNPVKTLQVGKESIKLTPAQQTAFNQNVGQQVQSAWNDIITSSDYTKLGDDKKKALLQSVLDDVMAVEKSNMLSKVGRSDLASKVKLTSQQKLVSQGSLNTKDYIQKAVDKAQGTSSNNVIVKVKAMDSVTRDNYLADPKNNYAYQLAIFQDNVKNGKLSDVQRYTKSLQIGKLAVLSGYSKDANELYGLSKTQLKAYLGDHKITQKVANELQAMDDALYQKGFIQKKKYASGLTGSKAKRQPSPPTPKFGNLGLVKVPKIPVASGNTAISTFKQRVGNLASLKLKVAPERKSRIKIAV